MLLTASASHDYVRYRTHETEFGQLTPESTSITQTPGQTKRYSVLLCRGGQFCGQPPHARKHTIRSSLKGCCELTPATAREWPARDT